MLRHFSCGGVVYRFQKGKLEFLMVQNKSGRWTFPEGTIELKESREQTALREVQEETGLENLKIDKSIGKSRYFFVARGHQRHGNGLVHKTVWWYLMKGQGQPRHQRAELADAKWVDADLAAQLKSYRNSTNLIKRAKAAISELEK